MTRPTLSIVIPVRNQPETLDELLASLEEQVRPTDWDVEVICVDNNSTDHTADVIRKRGVTYILEERLGPSVARNTGAARAQGELIWFMDADAVPLGSDFLQKIIATAGELGDFGGFGGPILLPESQRNNPIAYADHMACWSAWNKWRPNGESGFQPTSIVVRRSVFEAVGGYDTEIRVLEDWDLQQRLENSRRVQEGQDAPTRPVFFVQSLAVAHSARSTLMRTIRHSWYWGLPSRKAWLERTGIPVNRYEQPWRRWLGLPGLIWLRAQHPLSVGWRVSRWRTLLCLPFMLVTLTAWASAVIVGQGQPEDDRFAPF